MSSAAAGRAGVSEQAQEVPSIYRSFSGEVGVFRRAFELLGQAEQHLADAVRSFKHDLLESDTQVQLFRALLPELFCCRSLGDPFATVVNALQFAIENLQGELLDWEQLLAIRATVTDLRRRPKLNYEAALHCLDELEETGLVVGAPELDDLVFDA